MTIEEYIAREQRYAEKELDELRKIGALELFVRKQGALIELENIRAMLPKLEYGGTIDEVRQFCESHRNDDGNLDCTLCPFHYPSEEDYCEFWATCPCAWNGKDTARKIRKALTEDRASHCPAIDEITRRIEK